MEPTSEAEQAKKHQALWAAVVGPLEAAVHDRQLEPLTAAAAAAVAAAVAAVAVAAVAAAGVQPDWEPASFPVQLRKGPRLLVWYQGALRIWKKESRMQLDLADDSDLHLDAI